MFQNQNITENANMMYNVHQVLQTVFVLSTMHQPQMKNLEKMGRKRESANVEIISILLMELVMKRKVS